MRKEGGMEKRGRGRKNVGEVEGFPRCKAEYKLRIHANARERIKGEKQEIRNIQLCVEENRWKGLLRGRGREGGRDEREGKKRNGLGKRVVGRRKKGGRIEK